MSESHVRAIAVVGENARKYISDYTKTFQHDFLQLLRTSHGTKTVNANHFYNEYISNKSHVHMNASSFHSLSEFCKHLGREGICRVEEGDKGLEIAWIDASPEALRRQDALRKKERQDRGDEEREQMLIAEQIERARRDAEEKEGEGGIDDEEYKTLQREEGQKIKLNFGTKKEAGLEPKQERSPPHDSIAGTASEGESTTQKLEESVPNTQDASTQQPAGSLPLPDGKPKISLAMSSSSSKPKNVFASASKKNALGGAKGQPKIGQQRPMSEAERIMKEELERKRKSGSGGFVGGGKKMKI